MKKPTRKDFTNRVSILSNRIRTLYPHLYQSVGGRYVQKVLQDLYAQPKGH